MVHDRVDYDQIAPTYNTRFKHDHRDDIQEALKNLIDEAQAKTVLEAGCGTGRWIQAVQANLIIGLDRSNGMLRQAQSSASSLNLIQAQAEALPLANNLFGLVYCVNALHHFELPQRFIREAARILHTKGALAVIGTNPHGHEHAWYVYKYFESTYQKDIERFATWDMVNKWMRDCGLNRVELHPIYRIEDDKYGRAVLDDPFLQKNSTSQLILLSQPEYKRGLERIRGAIEDAESSGQEIRFPVSIEIEMLVGWK
jgi:ubiquinone/menaquinone biosynthesis C-methylase UbiE